MLRECSFGASLSHASLPRRQSPARQRGSFCVPRHKSSLAPHAGNWALIRDAATCRV